MHNLKKIISVTGILCILAAFVLVNPYHKVTGNTIISWDGAGYYLYLPCCFIYHDFKALDFIPHIFYKYELSNTFYQAFKVDNGNYVLTYPVGTAIMQLPFFLLAHLAAHFSTYPTDGFSFPYQLAIVIAGLFYCAWGLLLLYRLLTKYFDEIPALLTCLAVFMGTNLYNYAYTEPCMSHVYVFFLVCALLYLTDKWYGKPTPSYSLLLGLVAGLIVSVRPSVGIVFIVPLLWNVNSLTEVRRNLLFLSSNRLLVFLAAFAAALFIGLQMAYWKFATGHWLFNGYTYQHLGFSFLHPNLFKGLISFRKGWLIYTPLAFVMLAGIYYMRNRKPASLFTIMLYIIADTYIIFSWKEWKYCGGFGARAMIDSYAVLAIPFTALNVAALKSKKGRVFLFTAISACCFLNLFQTWQYNEGIIYSVGLCGNYEYRKFFLKSNRDLLPKSFIDSEGRVKQSHITSAIAILDSISPSSANLTSSINHWYIVSKEYKGAEIKNLKGNRLRYTVKAGYIETQGLYTYTADLYISFERNGRIYFENIAHVSPGFTASAPGNTSLELQIPASIRDGDVCKCLIADGTKKALRVFEQKVELLQVE